MLINLVIIVVTVPCLCFVAILTKTCSNKAHWSEPQLVKLAAVKCLPSDTNGFYMATLRQEAVVISGKKLARQIREEARADVENWVLAGHRRPHLSVVLVGDNPASHSYVLNKTRAAADVGKKKHHLNLNNKRSTVKLSVFSQLLSHCFLLNLPQESLVKLFSSIPTSARRSCWT